MMAEDIITALSHFKALFVIARNIEFTYQGAAVDREGRSGVSLGCATCWKGAFASGQSSGHHGTARSKRHRAQSFWADRFEWRSR